MLKRILSEELYRKMNCPDLNNIIYFKKGGKKIYGRVILLAFNGFKGAKNGGVLVGIEPLKKYKNK